MCPIPVVRDILVFEENTAGHDYIVGDIHGQITILAHIVKDLGPNDRLFNVGDRPDRGEDSLEVFRFMNDYNANIKRQLFSIRGNHEDILYRYIDTRLNPSNYDAATIMSIRNDYVSNGGEWATKLSNEQLSELKKLIKPLPYIIHVNGNNAFNIVHADMPFNDAELLQRIEDNNLQLTDEEKTYATWARNNWNLVPMKDTGRTFDDMPTYCGHSPLQGVRHNTNHVNIDLGSYETNHLGVVKHALRKCVIYTTAEQVLEPIAALRDAISNHLKPLGPIKTTRSQSAFTDKVNLKKSDIIDLLTGTKSVKRKSKVRKSIFTEPELSDPEASREVDHRAKKPRVR